MNRTINVTHIRFATGLLFWVFGILAFVSGITLYRSHGVSAQTAVTKYSSIWQVTKSASCYLTEGPVADRKEITYGPAEWTVTGSVGSSTKFKEIWTVGASNIVNNGRDTPGVNRCAGGRTVAAPIQYAKTSTGSVANTGPYTLSFFVQGAGARDDQWRMWGSYPNLWQVSGCVNPNGTCEP